MQTVPGGRQPIGGGIQTQDDGGGAERLKDQVECGDCGKEMAVGSLEAHRMIQHGNAKADKWS